MTARSHIDGHAVYFDTNADTWCYMDTGLPAEPHERPCRSCGKRAREVAVQGDDGRMEIALVDACIADVVEQLNRQPCKTFTSSSCCGHRVTGGSIGLRDGRLLQIRMTSQRTTPPVGDV